MQWLEDSARSAGRLLLIVSGLLIAAMGVPCASAAGGQVTVLTIDSAIGPATSDYVVRGLQTAAGDGTDTVVLRINTPGGLDTAMRDMIMAILDSPVPVVGYVAPAGARAASAGTYLLYAAHVAAMAPGTTLGAATPVAMGGLPGTAAPADEGSGSDGGNGDVPEPATAMDRKRINDAAAYLRELADLRGRNADWAEAAVRSAASLGAEPALEAGVIDLVAPDLEALLRAVDGRAVDVRGETRQLRTADAEPVFLDPDWRTDLLSILTNPNVAYVLFLIGLYGLIFEMANPGGIGPGVVGGICLLLALFAFQTLPISTAGLALLGLGIVLMVAEAFVPSFGILGIGGVVAFILGSLLLVDTGVEALRLSVELVVGFALVSVMLVIGIARMALAARRGRTVSGREAMLGADVVAVDDFHHGEGHVHYHGERWTARSGHPVRRGEHLRVRELEGLILEVEPDTAERIHRDRARIRAPQRD